MTVPVIESPDLASYLQRELTGTVRDYANNRPRARQSAIGASQLGHPCDRYLALSSLGYGRGPGTDHGDPWAAMIGTGVHSLLDKAFQAGNGPGKGDRWLTETQVEIAPGITGTCDLFDSVTESVIDHKVPADSTLKKVLAGDVSPAYRVQVQAYGYGLERAGYPVRNVALAWWPRGNGAWLGGVHITLWPYDPTITETALARWYGLVNAAIDLGLEHAPERAALLATEDGPCIWCPFYSRSLNSDHSFSCPGHGKKYPG